MENRKKLKSKKRICSEVSVSRLEYKKEGYSGKDLQKRKVLSLELKSEGDGILLLLIIIIGFAPWPFNWSPQRIGSKLLK